MDGREQVKTERRGGRSPGLGPASAAHGARRHRGPLLQNRQVLQPEGRPRGRSSAPTASPSARHAGQTRLSGEPFIEHPLAVAAILADLGLDTTTLEAALLHDTVEDTDVTLERARGGVRPGGRAHRRRPDQARLAHLPQPRAGAGRERSQDDRRDGRRHPGPADQARRPPPQHADARAAARRTSSAASRPRPSRSTPRSRIGSASSRSSGSSRICRSRRCIPGRTARSRASSRSVAASARNTSTVSWTRRERACSEPGSRPTSTDVRSTSTRSTRRW